MTPGERTLRARAAAYDMHAKHGSRKAAIKGQAALLAKFERQVDPEGLLTPEERRRRAKHARRAHMARLGPWMDLAACRGMVASADEDIFFAPDLDELGGSRGTATRVAATRERQALAVCDRCPVQVECLAYAVTTRQQHGVWGGKTQQEVRRLVANTDRPKRRPLVDVGLRRGPRPGSRGRCPAGHLYEEANTHRYGSRRVCRTCQLARVRARRLEGPTHCPEGHAYDRANTAYDARGHRRCRTCLRAGRSIRARRHLKGGGSDAA